MSKKAATRITFNAKLWIYPGETAQWHFVSVPKIISQKLKKTYAHKKRGWGSLRVRAKIGKTTWNTSIFPDSKTDTFLLPVKSLVRKQEQIFHSDTVSVSLEIL